MSHEREACRASRDSIDSVAATANTRQAFQLIGPCNLGQSGPAGDLPVRATVRHEQVGERDGKLVGLVATDRDDDQSQRNAIEADVTSQKKKA